MRGLLLALSLLTLASCSTFSKSSEQNLYKVHVGQSKEELLAAFGKPDRVATEGTAEKWFYNVYSADNRQIYPYTAVFENGTLAKWNFDTARSRVEVERRMTVRSPSSHIAY